MADYWKSQPKKFCSYCKCWIADNKPSIEFHERGKNHKENVVKKINEIKQKSMAKVKQDKKMAKEFAAMEEAALKAYEEDLKRLEGTTKPAPAPLAGPTIEERRARDEQKWKEMDAIEKHHAKRQWAKAFSAEGHPFFYNTLTGATQWEEPDGFQENSEKSEEQGAEAVWAEGVSDEGYTYYYNTETGESRWEKPEGIESRVSSSKDQKNSPATEDTAADTEKVVDIEKEAAGTEKEATDQELKPEVPPNETKSAEETTPAAPVTKTPKIHLRSKKEGQKDNDTGSDTDSEEEEEGTERKEETDGKNKKKTEEPSRELSSKRPRRTNPYGAWEQVQQEEDPYENVDLELPNVEYDDTQVQVPDVPGEPKVKFKEKTITSLGDTVTGAFAFKKRRLENVKSRNIRQRLNDQ